jgi:anti-sigma regulatory factor (Ser/Thr protein kinase)
VSGSVSFVIEDSSQTSQARRAALEMAGRMGLGEIQAGQVGIVVTEICTNILKHAGRGEILLRVTGDDSDGPTDLEVLALDRGPGMRDLERCLTDGYTTGSSPGQGMGAIRRLSTQSDFYSSPEEGTAILARWSPSAELRGDRLRIGAVNVPKKGQEVCGDSWGIEQNDEISLILVADGLGHGYEAHEASQEAVRMLRNNPNASAGNLLELTHSALRSFRGAAVAIARIDRILRQVKFAGAGNVMAQIYAGARPVQHLVSVNGTAGHQWSRLREFTYPWPEDGMLILFSDGLASGTGLQARAGLALCDPSIIAGVLYRDFARGIDDATVVVAKAA